MSLNRRFRKNLLKSLGVFLGIQLITPISPAWSYITKESKTPAALKDVRIEKGGLIQLNQYLKSSLQYNGKDHYRVEFVCSPGKKFDDCAPVKIEILPTSVSP